MLQLASCAMSRAASIIIQMEKSFLQNEGGYRDGLEPHKGKKQGVVTQ